jgi:hypothetical protein
VRPGNWQLMNSSAQMQLLIQEVRGDKTLLVILTCTFNNIL